MRCISWFAIREWEHVHIYQFRQLSDAKCPVSILKTPWQFKLWDRNCLSSKIQCNALHCVKMTWGKHMVTHRIDLTKDILVDVCYMPVLKKPHFTVEDKWRLQYLIQCNLSLYYISWKLPVLPYCTARVLHDGNNEVQV